MTVVYISGGGIATYIYYRYIYMTGCQPLVLLHMSIYIHSRMSSRTGIMYITGRTYIYNDKNNPAVHFCTASAIVIYFFTNNDYLLIRYTSSYLRPL